MQQSHALIGREIDRMSDYTLKNIENGQRGLKTSDNTVKRIKQVLD